MTLSFNTGRGYSVGGQVIDAYLVNETEVEGVPVCIADFYDHTRCVSGRVVVPHFTKVEVLAAYDKGFYDHIPNPEPFRDLAHEADMRELKREQLAADISPEEAEEECRWMDESDEDESQWREDDDV